MVFWTARRQTRPTYSPERRALHLFGNRFPLRPEYRPVLSCAWYDTISRNRDVAAGPGWASPGTSSWDLMKRLNAATAGSCMDCMEPEQSRMKAISVRCGFIDAPTLPQGGHLWGQAARLFNPAGRKLRLWSDSFGSRITRFPHSVPLPPHKSGVA